MKAELVNALIVHDRGPKWILFTNLVIWIQNRIANDRIGTMTQTGLEAIKIIVDHTRK